MYACTHVQLVHLHVLPSTYLKIIIKFNFPISLPVIVKSLQVHHKGRGRGLYTCPLQCIPLNDTHTFTAAVI